MADIKISELGAASAVNNTDLFPMTSEGVTVKATAQQLKIYMGVGNLADLHTTDKSSLSNAINEVDEHADNAQATANNAQQMIAPILSSLVAPSGGLESGDQFIYQGLLFKATAAIAQGGTITIDGNCELADSVTEQIKDLKSTSTYTGTYISALLNGNVVYVYNTASPTLTANADTSVGTLPQGYRPRKMLTLPCLIGSEKINTHATIGTDGIVSIYNPTSTPYGSFGLSATFIK